LVLPEEEREEFIAQNDVGSMTKQELQQAHKDRDQGNQAKTRHFRKRTRRFRRIKSRGERMRKDPQSRRSITNETR